MVLHIFVRPPLDKTKILSAEWQQKRPVGRSGFLFHFIIIYIYIKDVKEYFFRDDKKRVRLLGPLGG